MSSMVWIAAATAAAATPSPTAEEMLDRAKGFYEIEGPAAQSDCSETTPGEIVVCRETGDPERYRVPSDADRGVVKDNIPRAPDLEPKYPGVVVAKGCFIPPCPRPMPVMIDLEAIPEAPPGSDADRIAKGELAGP